MPEYFGDADKVALQQAIRARKTLFASEPALANGGRFMNILDPDAYGWDRVRALAEEDGLVVLTMVEREPTLDKLRGMLGPEIDLPCWEVFTGAAELVITRCAAVLSNLTLPEGWTVTGEAHPNEETIEHCQALNQATGVVPAPAYYLRGHDVPGFLTCIWTDAGALAACASGTMRYHADGLLGGWFFAGGVSVDPNHRRLGLGTCANASLLVESCSKLGWTHVLEQAHGTNDASIGMIRRSGLAPVPGKATIAVNLSGGSTTR